MRGLIDADAEKVVRKLARSGHKAYLVGGCVRDLLLGRTPKDFDVATSATPNEIRDLFRNCRIIGRRFRLAHIFFGNKIIETSTFRANPRAGQGEESELLIRRDNVFGSDTEDARRRDFTINGLFYDLETQQVIDHVGGLADLDAKLVRTIGRPDIRFQEDPVRMLRAVKFAARLGFDIERETYHALLRHRDEVSKCSPPRVLEEIYRLLRGGAAHRSMKLMADTGLDTVLSPRLAAMFRDGHGADIKKSHPDLPLDAEQAEWYAVWNVVQKPQVPPLQLEFAAAEEIADSRKQLWKLLELIDQMPRERQEFTNALLLAALMTPFLYPSMVRPGIRPSEANAMILELGQPLIDELKIARRDAERVRQVLLAQRRLAPSRRRRGRPMALVRRDYFDEALSVYELTARAADRDTSDVERWQRLKNEGNGISDIGLDTTKKRRRRRRGGRRRRRGNHNQGTNSDFDAVVRQ
ncbi:MAG: polynucleotide adenylyltransferase PcnB [Proteobacteria bacterium]|nr:polynucleotide adenylyltransferase PcnB [Pseudomonadota bacterium]